MQEIKCPHCGEVFQVDESGYAQIVQQVRDKEFAKELDRRAAELVQKAESDAMIAKMEQDRTHQAQMSQKEKQIQEKEIKIQELEARLKRAETEKQLAVTEAEKVKEQTIADQKNEIVLLKSQLDGKENEIQLHEKSMKEQYALQLKQKDEQIEYYKDLKARQSTKMVGETLEQHCRIQFDSIRMAAFPNAYFEKDNDARSGSKGDFIFRESAEDGTEFISIMFEMKNEMDETATKHKNEDFFKELDKDRREKHCEYAVLVSLLEIDNELYNSGIVDVSYKYEKMYVIRPQFFIPMISLLRNAAREALKYKQELNVVKKQQIDVVNFEAKMKEFKDGFARNYRIANDRFETAIDEIDKSIVHLQKIKENLLSAGNQLRLANNKADDLSIKKLTKDSPSIRAKFDEIGYDK